MRTATEQRTADVQLRYLQITLPLPAHQKAKAPIPLWVVHILEPSAPEETKPLQWFLLTTCALHSIDDAQACQTSKVIVTGEPSPCWLRKSATV